MADNPEFYRARAAEERANGDAALLDNVKDRCNRAEKAWEAMATRAERTQVLRIARETRTAENSDALTAEMLANPA